MFETGEYVVYGRNRHLPGNRSYHNEGGWFLRREALLCTETRRRDRWKIFTPVKGGKQVLRGIITREEAERLIDEIPSIETLSIENEKFREDSYKKCIRTCECRDLLRIIKTIYVRKQARLSHGKKINRYRRTVSEACRGSSLF